MTKIILLVLLWNTDDSITHNIVMVDECPPIEVVAVQFQPMQDAGVIKSWSALCQGLSFNFPENPKEEKEEKKEKINA